MNTPHAIAYLRVSTTDQDLEKNKFDILQLANDKGLGQVEKEALAAQKIKGQTRMAKRHGQK